MGPTHLSVDDLLLFQAIPGSAVLAPAEPEEAVRLTQAARNFSGLSYLRLAGTTASLRNPRDEIVLGKGRVLEAAGEVLFISCGPSTLVVESAVAKLKELGIDAGLLHLHTVKPLDVERVRRCAMKAKAVLCVEEHRQIGGLASAVLHALTTAEPPIMPARFASIGLDDTFPEGHGTYEELMDHYGISAVKLVERAEALLANARS
jgi:transketolase